MLKILEDKVLLPKFKTVYFCSPCCDVLLFLTPESLASAGSTYVTLWWKDCHTTFAKRHILFVTFFRRQKYFFFLLKGRLRHPNPNPYRNVHRCVIMPMIGIIKTGFFFFFLLSQEFFTQLRDKFFLVYFTYFYFRIC